MKELVIIGAGPSGIMAALQAVALGARPLLIEANDAIGRKLLVTGAGRCNITNLHASPERFTCSDPAFMRTVLGKVDPARLLDRLAELGILTHSTPDGWCYPRSESAHGVVALFAAALQRAGVELTLNTRIGRITREKASFTLQSENGKTIQAARLIVAAGGRAQPHLGATGNLFKEIQKLGHTVLPLRPALAPILADMKPYKALEGVRLDVHARLLRGDSLLAETRGNLIFTAWGLNGPAVMDLSHLVNGGEDLELDLLAGQRAELEKLFTAFKGSDTPLSILLGALLPPKVAPVILKQCHIQADAKMKDMANQQLTTVLERLTRLPLQVLGVRGFEYCQLKAGGVPVNEVMPDTMRSRSVEDLFLAGETLDVIGPCGGHNLHFAFASGWLAGEAAAL